MMNIEHIHRLSGEQIDKIPLEERIQNVIEALKEGQVLNEVQGSYFGWEIEYEHICVAINSTHLCVFKSSHNGFWSPNYISLDKGVPHFDEITQLVKETIPISYKVLADRLLSKIKE